MKEVKRIAYINRALYIGAFLMSVATLLTFMFVCKMSLKNADELPYINMANIIRLSDNYLKAEISPNVFMFLGEEIINIVTLGVLIYGLLRMSRLETGNHWILIKMLPISKKMRYVTELLEVLIASILGWGMAVFFVLFRVMSIENCYLKAQEGIYRFVSIETGKQEIFFRMCKLFPVVLLHVFLVYGLFLVWKSVINNEAITVMGMVVTYIACQAVGFFIEFIWIETHELVYPESVLKGIWAYAIVFIAAIALLAAGYFLHMKKDESKREIFQYKWAEVVFFVFTFITFFVIARSGVGNASWAANNPILLYGASLVGAVLLCGMIYTLIHKPWLSSKKIEKI